MSASNYVCFTFFTIFLKRNFHCFHGWWKLVLKRAIWLRVSQPSLAETKILETKDEEILLRFLELGIFDHIIHFHLPPFSCSDDIW